MNKKSKRKSKPKNKFTEFKKSVEVYFGTVNWRKVSTVVLIGLILVASKGALGPKAQIVAISIVDLAIRTYA